MARKYAQSKAQILDAILWVHSGNPVAIAQSYTDIALRLQLPEAHINHHAESRVHVLNWLQMTSRLSVTIRILQTNGKFV